MHYVAPGTYIERVGATFVLTISDTIVHEGRPMRLRVRRELRGDKLRELVPELFPIESASINRDIEQLRAICEASTYIRDDELNALILRVLDHCHAQQDTIDLTIALKEIR